MVMDLRSRGKVDGYIAFHSLSIIWYSLRIPDELVALIRILKIIWACQKDTQKRIDNIEQPDKL